MTSPSLSAGEGFGPLSYARSRLYLGISGVGTAVVAAVCLLYFDIPATGFSTSVEQSLGRSLFSLGIFFAMAPALFFIFDLLGGAWFIRRKSDAPVWMFSWVRGVALQWTVWMMVAAALMATARAVGPVATVGVFAAVQLLLALLRGRMARIVAPLPVVAASPVLLQAAERAGVEARRLQVVDTTDEGFVGGWSSIVPRTLVIPRRWELLSVDVLTAQLVRRKAVAASGAHMRGVLAAISWNTLGFVVVQQLLGATPATSAGLVSIMAGMTLWAFLGVLLLPTVSRAAVYAADSAAAATVGAAAVKAGIERLDAWQDDEPKRPPTVERVFHPVPSRTNRIAALGEARRTSLGWLHAHNVARQALWLGWGTFSPISRAVHCNVGRPALWVMLPGD